MSDLIGKTILHYRVIEQVGQGGMGVVYKAEDTKLERDVAIKFLPRIISANSEKRERFKIEAKAAAALNHSNIATIHANEEYNDEMFIVMEYIDGKELKDKIKSGPISSDEVINIANQIAEGLDAAHKKGIVHRDIKSSNIMITKDGKVKIMDFGLAKIKGGTELTKIGSTVGTVAYMSPEQAKGEVVDNKTDIWSLGVVLFEMLTGELPFKGDYDQSIIYSILNEEPKFPTELRADIPQSVSKIIITALKKKPDDRYQEMKELISVLKGVIDSSKNNVKAASLRNNNSQPKRLAVLPFINVSGESQSDFLGFALADQIIGAIAYSKNLLVRPSSSVRKFQNKIFDLSEISRELNVEYILTGNYLKMADKIRLSIELVESETENMIWQEPIEVDFNNAFELQDIVAQKVVEGLSVQFSQKEFNRIVKDVPDNPLAYEYYLRSISYPYTNEGDELAIGMLQKSIELDSHFAPAYDQLGGRIHRLAQYGLGDPEETKKAENYYLKALSLNEDLISALGHLASIYTETNRAEKAMVLIKQMLEINPNNSIAHYSLGYIYRYAGMLTESIREMENALALDPKNSEFRSILITYQFAGEFEKVFEVIKNFKQSAFIIAEHGATLFRQGNRKQAIKYFDRAIAMEPEGLQTLWVIGMKAFIEQNIEEGLKATQKFEQINIVDAEAWYHFAGNYGLLGDIDGCIRSLQRAVDGGFFNYPFMLTDFYLDSMRDDPEFQKVLEKAKEKHLAFKKRFF